MSQFNCDHHENHFLLRYRAVTSVTKEPKAKNWYTYGLLKDWKSRTIISQGTEAAAWYMKGKNVDIYHYKWMDWQRSLECSISLFQLCIFWEKGRKYGGEFQYLKMQDIDYICMCEEKLQSEFQINSKQCIQNPLLNTVEWVRKVAQTCTSKIRCDFKMSRNLRGIERWNSKSLRKSTGKVQHVLLLSVWQMVMSNVKKPHNSQLFGMVWQPS